MALKEWDLTGKVALITGTGRGWTPILAGALAEAGANVAIAGPDSSERQKAAQAVQGQGSQAIDVQADLTRAADVQQAVQQTVSRLGGLDILVNNTQVEFGKPFTAITEGEWDRLMELNAKSLFLCCQETGKEMLRRGKGRIINIISGLAERGLWNSVAYCATQGAALQLTRALALEWGRHSIRVNAIGTGFLTLEEVPPEQAQQDRLVRYIPSRRKGHPRDIVGALVYLASDAYDSATGICVYVDGGLMSHP